MTLLMMQKLLKLDTLASDSLETLNNDVWHLKKDYENVHIKFNESIVIGNIVLIPVEYVEDI